MLFPVSWRIDGVGDCVYESRGLFSWSIALVVGRSHSLAMSSTLDTTYGVLLISCAVAGMYVSNVLHPVLKESTVPGVA